MSKQMVWTLETPLAELNGLPSQPPFSTDTQKSFAPTFNQEALAASCASPPPCSRDTLKMLVQTVHNSPNPVHVFKVESCAGIAGHPFCNMTWLASEGDTLLFVKIP